MLPHFKHLYALGYLRHLCLLHLHTLLEDAHLGPLLADELLLLTPDCLRPLKLVKELCVVPLEPLVVLGYLKRLVDVNFVAFEFEVKVLITLLQEG